MLIAALLLATPDYASAASATLKQIKAGDWVHLTASLDPNGVRFGFLDAANLKLVKPAQFKAMLGSAKKVTWIPPMDVEGDTAPAYQATLKQALKEFQARDWAKGKVSYGRSIEPGAYRTLFISDLQPKMPKAKFVEYYFGNPKAKDESIFDMVLVLGYTKVGTQYRLSVLAQDSWKD